MGREYTAKAFKSGNSVALRLPKALGVQPGEFTTIVQDEDGDFAVKRGDRPRRKFNIDKVWGIAAGSGMELIKSEDRVFERCPLIWDDTEWLAKHANKK